MATMTHAQPEPKLHVKKIYVINVKQSILQGDLNLHEKQFSKVFDLYHASRPRQDKGVLAHLTLKELETELNTTTQKIAILKGLYDGGTKGEFCSQVSNFLPIDIDVKKAENKILQKDQVLNERVFELMQKICVLSFRSTSKKGIAGFVYAPQMNSLNFTNNTLKHKRIAEAIYSKIESIIFEKLNVKIELDKAQGSFRQIRYLAPQDMPRSLNLTPYCFDFDITEKVKKDSYGITQFYAPIEGITGTKKFNFNQNTTITSVLNQIPEFTFLEGNKVRYSKQTTEGHAGYITNDNTLLSFSNTLSNDIGTSRKKLTPYDLVLAFNFKGNLEAFNEYLKANGIKDTKPQRNAFEDAKNEYKNKIDSCKDAEKLIYKICQNLVTASVEDKNTFLLDLNPRQQHRNAFLSYLKIGTNLIFDSEIQAKRYVSEGIEELCQVIENNQRTIIKAETGTGKTTAIVNDFKNRYPESRMILLAPLTAIVDQLRSAYKNTDIVFLTGRDNAEMHRKARFSKFIVATYEQGAKHLKDEKKFDYIFVDEVHQLFLANEYKTEVITDLNTSILKNENAKIIGLTGTPNNLFRNLGFHICNIKTSATENVDLKVRYTNAKVHQIVLNHIKAYGKAERYIFRVNEIQTINDLKNTLKREFKYREREIIVLHSTSEIKNSDAFKKLVSKGVFSKSIKVVLTTSIIDEGLSIYDKFYHSVFIETSFSPKAEPIKQYFARFRDTKKDTNLFDTQERYLYLRDIEKQKFDYSLSRDFENKLELLEENEYEKTTWHDFTDPKQFYYNDFSVNKYYLANYILGRFYAFLDRQKFLDYLSLNFNINPIRDANFKPKSMEVIEHQSNAKARNKDFVFLIKNDFVGMLSYLHKYSYDKKMSERIEDYLKEKNEKIALSENSVFYTKYIKHTEKIVRTFFAYYFLDAKSNPEDVLINKGKLKNSIRITNELFTIRIRKTVENPQTPKDYDLIKQLERVKSDLIKMKFIKVGQFCKILQKHRILNFNKYTKNTLENLIDLWDLPYKYDAGNKEFSKIG